MPNIEITATSNVQPGIRGLQDVQRELGNTAIAAGKVDNSLSVTGKGTEVLNEKVTKLGLGLKKLGGPVGEVGHSLHTLSEGFAEAGLAGLAIGGLSILAHFFTERMRESAEATRKAAEQIAILNKENESIISTITKEVVHVEALVDGFKKENLTRKEKIDIISKLQSISPQYFSNLDKENTTVAQLTAAYDNYSNSIIRNIEIKIKEGELAKVTEKRLALQEKGLRNTNFEIDANGKVKKSYNAVFDAESDGRKKGFNALILTNKEQAELNNLLASEKELLTGLSNLTQPQDFLKNTRDGKAKDIRTIQDVLSDLNKQLDFLNTKELILNTNEAKGKISALQSAFDELVKNFKLDGKSQIVIDIVAKINRIETAELQADFTRQQQEAIKKLPQRTVGLDKPVIVKTHIKFEAVALDASLAKFQQDIDTKVQSTFTNIASGIADSFATSIGEALANGNFSLPDLFGGLIKGIGTQLKELGQYMVKVGVEYLVLKKALAALKLNPVAAIAAGFALEILGSALVASANKRTPQGFATGVSNYGGGVALVGERGPELVQLPRGSNVRTNGQLNAMGGNNQPLVADIVIRGKDLVAVFKQATAYNSRNGL